MTIRDMNDIFPNGGAWVVTPGGALPINRLMEMCHWMGSHFHNWIDYNGIAFSTVPNRVTRMGLQIELSRFWGKENSGLWDKKMERLALKKVVTERTVVLSIQYYIPF